MRLTAYTDYSLRTLMHLAINQDHLVTIQEIANLHGISKNHLTKVVHQLGISGLVTTVRGRNGGFKLGMSPKEINIGEVIRTTENDFFMAECFEQDNKNCAYSSACILKDLLAKATLAYLAVLDEVTLEDLIKKPTSKKSNSIPIDIKLLLKR